MPSEFNRHTFRDHGVEEQRLSVLPQSIDVHLFDPDVTTPLTISTTHNAATIMSDDFVFLSVFKWEARKGWDVLLQATPRRNLKVRADAAWADASLTTPLTGLPGGVSPR